MPIKMIVTDMDGTFLNDAHTYNHARFAQALHLMQKRGVKFVLASGSSTRAWSGSLPATKPSSISFPKMARSATRARA